jgi:hypothetical protein
MITIYKGPLHKDEKQHNDRLRVVLRRAEDANLKLNKTKSKIGLTEVKYMGHLIGRMVSKPTPRKSKRYMQFQNRQIRKNFRGSWAW